MLTAALDLAARGFRVHPLRDRDKRPVLKDWPQLASSDAEQVRALWRDRPMANIGIATGALADGRRFFVLDVDDGEALAALQDEHGQLPPTLTAETARGGWHVYLLSGGREIRNAQGRPAPGLDIRGAGGYVVAPPSIGAGEAPYVWAHEADIAPAPEWLLELLRRRPAAAALPAELPANPERIRRAAAYLAKLPQAVSGQAGHMAAWRAALTVVRGFALDEPAAYQLLAEQYNPRCEPPWSESELRHKVADALKSRAPVGYKLAPREIPAPPPADDQEMPPRFDLIQGGDQGGSPDRVLKGHGPSLACVCRVLENADLRHVVLGPGRLRWNDLRDMPEYDGAEIDKHVYCSVRVEAERHIFAVDAKTGDKKVVPIAAETVEDAVLHVASEDRYHPVREWLATLPPATPGTIELAGKEALGLRDSLDMLLWRKWLIGAVARVSKPGCQMDTVLTLVAPGGGQRKSSFLRALLTDEWFSDSHLDMIGFGRTNAYMQLHRVWVYEVPELEACDTDRERSRAKSFISTRSDNFRSPYEPRVRAHLRTVVLAATTNGMEFLSLDDLAFNRRFWPIRIRSEIDTAMISALRAQIWAEARDAYVAGEPWHLEDESVLDRLRERHTYLAERDPWADQIATWAAAATEDLTTPHALAHGLSLEPKDWDQRAARRVGRVFRTLGFELRRRRSASGAALWVWAPAESDPQGIGTSPRAMPQQ